MDLHGRGNPQPQRDGVTEMTEREIEIMAERKMDALDARLLSGVIDQKQYDAAVRQLDARVRHTAVGRGELT